MNHKDTQRYAVFVARTLQDIEGKHETGSLLVVGQVLSIVLTDLARGTEHEPAVKRLVQLWQQAVTDEQGPLMLVQFTTSAIRRAVESEE